jgi:hypothetical protein
MSNKIELCLKNYIYALLFRLLLLTTSINSLRFVSEYSFEAYKLKILK